MDPFLEHPAFSPGLHGRFVTYCSESIQQKLPPPYYAEIGERLWVETVKPRHIEPDVDVLHRADQGQSDQEGGGGAVAAAPAAAKTGAKPWVIQVFDDERRETFLNIATRSGDTERIVATIELLSLTNKPPGEKGRDLYLKKQQKVVDGNIHLIEIDLLRAGTHATFAPKHAILRKAGAFDYHVCVHRADDPINAHVYTIQLVDRLPPIGIPLLPGDGEIELDLQAVFDRCYDAGPYRRRVRYDLSRLEPPLSPERTAWAAELLRAQGLLAEPPVTAP
jgi:hypothetical protein